MTKSQIKILDKLWSQKIKELAEYKCEYCLDNTLRLNSCHVVGRRHRGTRWLLDNGICLCFNHHKQYDEHGPEHEAIRRVVIGEERIERLHSVAQSVARAQDYETIRREIIEGRKTF